MKRGKVPSKRKLRRARNAALHEIWPPEFAALLRKIYSATPIMKELLK